MELRLKARNLLGPYFASFHKRTRVEVETTVVASVVMKEWVKVKVVQDILGYVGVGEL
jgi:hypothetical protein